MKQSREKFMTLRSSGSSQQSMNDDGPIATFSLQTIGLLRFIQLRETGGYHAVLAAGAFEIFGLLFDSHFRPVSEADGIVTFLRRQCGGSLHEKSMVIATVSTCIAGWDHERAVSETDEKSWFSEDAADQ
jgi:hypothetical protein